MADTQIEFLRHLHDTIILLGGDVGIANMLDCVDLLDDASIESLRVYNIRLNESLKTRLCEIHTTTVLVEPKR